MTQWYVAVDTVCIWTVTQCYVAVDTAYILTVTQCYIAVDTACFWTVTQCYVAQQFVPLSSEYYQTVASSIVQLLPTPSRPATGYSDRLSAVLLISLQYLVPQICLRLFHVISHLLLTADLTVREDLAFSF